MNNPMHVVTTYKCLSMLNENADNVIINVDLQSSLNQFLKPNNFLLERQMSQPLSQSDALRILVHNFKYFKYLGASEIHKEFCKIKISKTNTNETVAIENDSETSRILLCLVFFRRIICDVVADESLIYESIVNGIERLKSP